MNLNTDNSLTRTAPSNRNGVSKIDAPNSNVINVNLSSGNVDGVNRNKKIDVTEDSLRNMRTELVGAMAEKYKA